MSGTGLIRAYSGLTKVIAPALPFWLKRRAVKGKEDPARQGERFGISSLPRPDGQLFWMHGASVGEVTMLLPLIDKVLAEYPSAHVLVTSGTTTSAELMAKRLPERAFHQYIPLDTPKAVSAFLDHWIPSMALWAESEIWPNLILQTKARNIPMALINARMSEKSLQGWSKRRKSAESLFGCFDVILAGDERTANGLSKILGTSVENIGNLKNAAPALTFDPNELSQLKESIGKRPIWIAASVHHDEADYVFRAHEKVLESHPKALLIYAMRHPTEKLVNNLKSYFADHIFAQRSLGTIPHQKTGVFLYDTLGEMGLAYSLSDAAFVAGSLRSNLMGHNPLEPARLNIPTVTGPYISSFQDTYAPFLENNAMIQIAESDELGKTITAMLSSPKTRQNMVSRASTIVNTQSDILNRTVDAIKVLL